MASSGNVITSISTCSWEILIIIRNNHRKTDRSDTNPVRQHPELAGNKEDATPNKVGNSSNRQVANL
jgi:hypothetical protein